MKAECDGQDMFIYVVAFQTRFLRLYRVFLQTTFWIHTLVCKQVTGVNLLAFHRSIASVYWATTVTLLHYCILALLPNVEQVTAQSVNTWIARSLQ